MASQIPAYAEWLRFDRYEVADGYVRPARDARVERYNPWDDYWASIRPSAKRPPPYQSLLELADNLELGRDKDRLWLTPDSVAMLIAWCNEHGVLGWLPHHTQAVFLSPRWQNHHHMGITLTQRRFFRLGGQWLDITEPDESPGHQSRAGIHKEGELATVHDVPESWPTASVSLRSSIWRPAGTEPLTQTWGKFFPDVPEDERQDFLYSPPSEPRFWQLYAEPIELFVDFSRAFRDGVRALSRQRNVTQVSDNARSTDELLLNALAAEVSRAIVPTEDGQLIERWISPSLVGTYAMMALQDLTEQRRVRTCDCCNGWFVSRSPKALYCSSTCRFTEQKRRYRAKKRKDASNG